MKPRIIAAGWTTLVFTIGFGMGIATGANTAHAAPDTGTYDELTGILDEDGTFSYITSTRGHGFTPEPEDYDGGNVFP